MAINMWLISGYDITKVQNIIRNSELHAATNFNHFCFEMTQIDPSSHPLPTTWTAAMGFQEISLVNLSMDTTVQARLFL